MALIFRQCFESYYIRRAHPLADTVLKNREEKPGHAYLHVLSDIQKVQPVVHPDHWIDKYTYKRLSEASAKHIVRVCVQTSREKPKTPPGWVKWILFSGKPVALFIVDYSSRKSSVMMPNRLAKAFKYFLAIFPFLPQGCHCTAYFASFFTYFSTTKNHLAVVFW